MYVGQESVPGVGVFTKIVMELTEDYLDKGRTMYTDNWYTSVTLANQLLNRSTNLVGTLRSNRKFNPVSVVKAKLKKAEIISRKYYGESSVLKKILKTMNTKEELKELLNETDIVGVLKAEELGWQGMCGE
ncbi:hypothetical protein QTP88_009699 [Uroleucon formosanum]